jgi:hypothetical protein
MNNFAFCTIAYGEKYLKWSKDLISDILSKKGSIFVLTSSPDFYQDISSENLNIVMYDKPYFSFNEKRTIVKKCLENFSTAVFLDADVRIFDIENFDFLNNIDNGLHIFNTFGSLENTFLNNDVHPCYSEGSRNTKYGKAGLDFLEQKKLKYKKKYHGSGYPECYLEHFLEGKWVLKKDDGRENVFLDIWGELADFSEKIDIELGYKNNIGAGEGGHMSIAAYNSDIKLNLRHDPLCSVINKNFVSNYERKVSGEISWGMIG